MIPKSWNKIPLENFVHYLEYKDEEPETLEERFDLLYKRTCAILGCSVKEAKALTVEDQGDLVRLMNSEFPTKLKPVFRHKGIRYRKIPQIKDMDGGRYAAIKNAAKRGAQDNLHHILFLVCEPIKLTPYGVWKPYEFKPEEIEDRIRDFKSLPMEVANPITVFFLTLSKLWKDLLDDYSIQTLTKMTGQMEELQTSLESDMDGQL